MKCENGRLIVPGGWEIVEGDSNQMEYMVKGKRNFVEIYQNDYVKTNR